MLAINIATSFMSIYLYQHGYSVLFIASFWAVYFAFKAAIALPCAAVSGWIGPKHAILLSNILFIPSMIAFAMVTERGIAMLIIVGILQGISTTLYAIAYNIDFSKVKSVEHAGKEIAYMNIIEKITTGLSPVIGGVLAFLVSPEIVLLVAAVLFALAALPLLRTAEQVAPRQKLQFAGFPWRLIKGMGVSQWAVGFDVFTSGTAWSLFAAIFIIGIASNNEIYLVNGLLMSVVLVAALLSSYAYGRLIDKRRGKELLQVTVVANALTHMTRPFIASPVSIASLNVANEMATTGYTMSYHRAVFDNADLSGRRTAYLGLVEMLGCFGAASAALVAVILVSCFGDQQGLSLSFFVTGIVVLLVLTARFPIFRR